MTTITEKKKHIYLLNSCEPPRLYIISSVRDVYPFVRGTFYLRRMSLIFSVFLVKRNQNCPTLLSRAAAEKKNSLILLIPVTLRSFEKSLLASVCVCVSSESVSIV